MLPNLPCVCVCVHWLRVEVPSLILYLLLLDTVIYIHYFSYFPPFFSILSHFTALSLFLLLPLPSIPVPFLHLPTIHLFHSPFITSFFFPFNFLSFAFLPCLFHTTDTLSLLLHSPVLSSTHPILCLLFHVWPPSLLPSVFLLCPLTSSC